MAPIIWCLWSRAGAGLGTAGANEMIWPFKSKTFGPWRVETRSLWLEPLCPWVQTKALVLRTTPSYPYGSGLWTLQIWLGRFVSVGDGGLPAWEPALGGYIYICMEQQQCISHLQPKALTQKLDFIVDGIFTTPFDESFNVFFCSLVKRSYSRGSHDLIDIPLTSSCSLGQVNREPVAQVGSLVFVWIGDLLLANLTCFVVSLSLLWQA